jgi:hypothetical protein
LPQSLDRRLAEIARLPKLLPSQRRQHFPPQWIAMTVATMLEMILATVLATSPPSISRVTIAALYSECLFCNMN